jgi:UDP-N-acetylglucosamine:LPS N-acetylglucosamine transferase
MEAHIQDMLRRYPKPVLLKALHLYSRLWSNWGRREEAPLPQSASAESAKPSPTAASPRRKVLFFSRGLGMGHATRDVAIAQTLQSLAPDVEVTFASYARGLPMLRNAGYAPIDLGLPPQGQNNQRLLRIGQVIQEQRPHLVVSDEELLALPLARLHGVLPVLITNWLIEEQRYSEADYMNSAAVVIFPDFADSFALPTSLHCPVIFVGPIVRPFLHSLQERDEIRATLGVGKETRVLCVITGGNLPDDLHFVEASLAAFQALDRDSHLIMLAGELKETIAAKMAHSARIILEDYAFDADQYVIASDLVVCRGGHNTLWELARLGIPSISVPPSPQVNLVGMVYAENMERRGTTVTIKEPDLTPERLHQAITDILSTERRCVMAGRGRDLTRATGEEQAAQVILDHLALTG